MSKASARTAEVGLSAATIRELSGQRWDGVLGVSCYLDVDGRRYPRHSDYEGVLDGMLRRGMERAGAAGLDIDSVQADVRRIRDHVRGGFDRSSTRGLAFFSCVARYTWQVLTLPVPVRTHVHIGDAPALGPLEAVLDAHECFAVLLVDRQRVRLVRVAIGVVDELADEADEARGVDRDPGRGGRRKDRAQSLDTAAGRQRARRAAQIAFDAYQTHGYDRLVVGATETVAAEVEAELHPYLTERLAGRASLAPDAGADDVRRAVAAIEVEVELARQRDEVERLRASVATHNGAVAGLAGVLGALQARRVATLLVSDGYEAEGWRCSGCSALAAVGRTCPACRASMQPLPDVVQVAIEHALVQNCAVTVCTGNADLDVLGRIGALLRY